MAFAAHLSKSNENSLEARVNNFRSAYAAYRDIQTSLDMAVKDFSKSELDKAQKLGLISDLEARNIDALNMGNDFTVSPAEHEIQENKNRIAEARASMNAKNNEKSKDKDKGRDF